MNAVTPGAVRGIGAAVLLGVGLGLAAVGGVGPAGPTAGIISAGAGAAWLAGEWWSARSRARRLERGAGRLRSRLEELVSSREELEHDFEDLQDHQAEVVSSARLATLGSLTAGIAHELDTPLGSLRSNLDTLQRSLNRLQDILADERVDESELDDIRRIVRAVDGIMDTNELAVDRLVELVESLRTFARPDRSERDRVDLHEALEETLALLQHELRDGIRVSREFGDLPLVECYPAKLNQAFMNLLVNACHAIEDEGEIAIRTSAADGRVEVRIEDSGRGISPEHLGRIFEPGFTTKGSRVGMGLGLPITRQVVEEEHRGGISVESEPGEGTRFTLRLPVELPSSGSGG